MGGEEINEHVAVLGNTIFLFQVVQKDIYIFDT